MLKLIGKSCNIKLVKYLFFYPHLRICFIDFRGRGRERDIDVEEKH